MMLVVEICGACLCRLTLFSREWRGVDGFSFGEIAMRGAMIQSGLLPSVLPGAGGACLGLVLLALSPAALSADPVFTPEATEACVQEVEARSAGLPGHAALDCVGRAAQVCMTGPGGDTTIGMIDCLSAENDYWDARLNTAYAARMAGDRQSDDEMARLGSASVSLAEALREMQRAWIAYRDATCLYEQAQWLGGSGGGPATAACHMQETARQALKLEGWWEQ